MALYEYSCNDCGTKSELLVFSGDTPACPKCGSENLTKLMSSFAVSMGSSTSSAPVSGYPSGGSCPSGTCGLM